jgi:large repetitive protein
MNTEANALVDEFNRIVQSTSFNGLNLLDANLGIIIVQAGIGSEGTLSIGFTDQLGRAVGDGTFATRVSIATGSSTRGVVTADLNGDGKLDMITNEVSGVLGIYLGNGDGTFAARKTVASGNNPRSVAVGDINGDGKLDLVSADYGSSAVGIYLGNGDGTFAAGTSLATGTSPNSVELADFNGDGRLDLASADSGTNNISVRLGNGDGTFGAQASHGTGSGPRSVKARAKASRLI